MGCGPDFRLGSFGTVTKGLGKDRVPFLLRTVGPPDTRLPWVFYPRPTVTSGTVPEGLSDLDLQRRPVDGGKGRQTSLGRPRVWVTVYQECVRTKHEDPRDRSDPDPYLVDSSSPDRPGPHGRYRLADRVRGVGPEPGRFVSVKRFDWRPPREQPRGRTRRA